MVAMATAAKTAVLFSRPTPGLFQKLKGALIALVTLLPQLWTMELALAEMQFL